MVNNMKIWINKCIAEERATSFIDAITFNISVPGQGGRVASNIRDGWYRALGIQAVTPICEDLYIIALSVFATDKRIPRSKTPDNWTREVHLNVPVIMVDQWNFVKEELERMLSYLSGDLWHFTFRSCEIENRYKDNHVHAPARNTLLNRIDGVSLFSGGLDSFCGAYDFMMKGKNTVFVGFKEYGKLESVQRTLMDSLNCCFPDIVKLLFTFTARACCPLGTENLPPENTSRSRSFLFICAAICVAEVVGDDTPVYIPENGFIGLNLPLTMGRSGSCSTRTTHPYFIKMLNGILGKVGIQHEVINPFAFQTKREIVQQFIAAPGFLENIHKTISCSHPCNGRWQGKTEPENCGYCYPCLIRQSSLVGVLPPNEHYSYDVLSLDYLMNATNAKRSDFVDLLSSINEACLSTDEDLMKRIKATGRLTQEETHAFLRLYKETIADLIRMLSVDPELLRIAGVHYATN